LHLEYLSGAGTVVVVYLLARTVGTVLGVWAGGTSAGMDKGISRRLGFALLPQAGVALGLSLIAAQELPEYEQTILTVVLTSTVILELTSPMITRAVLRRDVADRAIE
jgi:Kef-type K+ transport system membrane component KefB